MEQATWVRRETASGYLKAVGVAVRARRGRPRVWPNPATTAWVSTGPGPSKPATTGEVSTNSEPPEVCPKPGRAPSASACEAFREEIAHALGRNAMAIPQDLVEERDFQTGYASVKRFVSKLRGSAPAEARVVIATPPGEEAQAHYGEGPMVRDPQTG